MTNFTPTYCSNCGKELTSHANFCVYCSAKIQPVSQNQPVVFPVQPVPNPVFERHFNISPPESHRRVSIWLGIGILFMPYIFAWFTLRDGYSTQARAICFGWAGFIILFNFIGIVANLSRPSPSTTPSSNISSNVNTAQQKAANAMANAANAMANAANLVTNPKTKTTVKQSPCTAIQSELASVESDQAGNEKALDLYEGMEGSIGQGSYLNALREKGRLQLQHIALERKLKACGRKK